MASFFWLINISLLARFTWISCVWNFFMRNAKLVLKIITPTWNEICFGCTYNAEQIKQWFPAWLPFLWQLKSVFAFYDSSRVKISPLITCANTEPAAGWKALWQSKKQQSDKQLTLVFLSVGLRRVRLIRIHFISRMMHHPVGACCAF